AIVKILMRYEGQKEDGSDLRWAMGTGYLISPDTFITAGHCVFDRSNDNTGKGGGLGRVKLMKCFIGYRGRASINEKDDSTVQSRKAIKTATTAGWLTTGDRRGDVAFVKIDRPFTAVKGLNNFNIQDTPIQETGAQLGIVGYPGDKYLIKEKGAEMYESFESIDFNLDTSNLHMLQYKISTFKGILPEGGNQVVIGTHCYGGNSTNSASVIGGQYGVNYSVFLNALNTPRADVKDITNKPFTETGTESGIETGTESGLEDSEDFFDILKGIGRVVLPVAQGALSLASPLLGPFGGPVSAIGGVALGALNKAVSEADFDFASPIAPKVALESGVAERAVIAEAALQTVLRMEQSRTSKGIIDRMQKKYAESGFTTAHANNIGPKLVPLLSQAGLRMAVNDSLPTAKSGPKVFSTATKTIRLDGSEADLGTGDEHSDRFLKAVSESAVTVLQSDNTTASGQEKESSFESDTEGFFSGLPDLFTKAFKVAKPVLIAGARAGLSAGLKKLDDVLVQSKDAGTEALLENEDTVSDKVAIVTDEKAASLLATRAVMAECALQAVLEETNTAALKESVILGDATGAVQSEGFFDSMIKTIQVIGPAVLKTAPAVIRTAVPLLLRGVAGALDGKESGSVSVPPVTPKAKIALNGISSLNGVVNGMNGLSLKNGVNGTNGLNKGVKLNGSIAQVSNLSIRSSDDSPEAEVEHLQSDQPALVESRSLPLVSAASVASVAPRRPVMMSMMSLGASAARVERSENRGQNPTTSVEPPSQGTGGVGDSSRKEEDDESSEPPPAGRDSPPSPDLDDGASEDNRDGVDWIEDGEDQLLDPAEVEVVAVHDCPPASVGSGESDEKS
ncbi:hypothetical protein B0T17DRAFT_500616, partial [Bombardia bombarda]